ncbi:hypothetical protein G6F65_016668 [Rhizopus arrhizus]|nr:hypothetical protein G6F65_016668 [Rhizopus arrhizus]
MMTMKLHLASMAALMLAVGALSSPSQAAASGGGGGPENTNCVRVKMGPYYHQQWPVVPARRLSTRDLLTALTRSAGRRSHRPPGIASRPSRHTAALAFHGMLHETVFMEWRDSTMLPRFHRRALCALLALALPVFACAATPAPLKVMSFNVRTPADTEPGKRWPDRRDAMVKVILDAHPAVIGTQELVKEQADYLSEHLPGYRWFGEGRRGGSGDEHMGVFYDSKVLAIEASGNFWLSDTPDVPGSITWGNLMVVASTSWIPTCPTATRTNRAG